MANLSLDQTAQNGNAKLLAMLQNQAAMSKNIGQMNATNQVVQNGPIVVPSGSSLLNMQNLGQVKYQDYLNPQLNISTHNLSLEKQLAQFQQ